MNPTVIALGRVLLSVVFLLGGYGKLVGAEGFSGYLGSLGFPSPLIMAYLVGAFELVAGAMVLVGFQTRIAAFALAAFCVATAFIGHAGDWSAIAKNVSLAGGFLVLAGAGAGAFAADRPARERRY